MVSVTYMELDFFYGITEMTQMSENYQHTGPKQDTGKNLAISSASITKLKNKGTWRGSKNSESGSNVREAWKCEDCEKIFKSEKDRMLECEYCGN